MIAQSARQQVFQRMHSASRQCVCIGLREPQIPFADDITVRGHVTPSAAHVRRVDFGVIQIERLDLGHA